MTHEHIIKDSDRAFVINPVSRMITKETDAKTTVMQFDHNSERLTFTMPRIVEGHDMTKSDVVQIHFINSGTGTSVSARPTRAGIHRVRDLVVSDTDPDTLAFSWLISEDSTQLAGTLSFLVKFICYGEADLPETAYKWHTHPCSFINILAGMNNSEEVAEINSDAILEIEKRLEELANNEEIDKRFSVIEQQIADLMYKPISVTSFTNNVGTVEMGTVVNQLRLDWALSKTAKTISLNGESLDPSTVTWTGSNLNLTANKTFTLAVTDERDTKATKTTSITFLNGVYYGAAAAPTEYDSAFILGLTRTLRSSKLPSFTVNASTGKHIYYALPTRYGKCTFAVGGFTGGFELVDTVSFKNASGYSENYYIYKSVNASLGNTTVSVT